MAYRTTRVTNSGDTRMFYNVDYAVGMSGWNMPVDAKLVQALLRLCYYELEGKEGALPPPPGVTEPIEVDGLIGPISRRHIMHFQQQQAQSGTATLIDGRFDPFRAQGQASTIAKVEYGLGRLNTVCNNVCSWNGLDWFRRFYDQPYVASHTDLLFAICGPVRQTAHQYGG